MLTFDKNLTDQFITALTGSLNTVIDWRCIHDQRKDLPAHNYRGTLEECLGTLQSYNSQGYGIFACINQLDGTGRELPNVQHVRAHVVDLDSITAQGDYDRAVISGASFAVQSSTNKFHVYWSVEPYVGNDFYTLIQRKLVQTYNGDPKVIDATRVMRVPGFLHLKAEPKLVTYWPLPAIGRKYTAQEMQNSYIHVNVFDHVTTRFPLGTADMQAPSMEWLRFAMSLLNPNDLDRGEWLSISAAFKQAGWNLSDDATLQKLWLEWCGQYSDDNQGENVKLWNSIKDTETGWATFQRRTTIKAYIDFGFKDAPPIAKSAQTGVVPPRPATPAVQTSYEAGADNYSEILSADECSQWFKNCYFIDREGKIFNPAGRFMNSTQFNGKYGGKQFIISSVGKMTDEPWKAALRSTVWTIPKVDHVRFLPDRPSFDMIIDSLGRTGLNTYIPARIDAVQGDISPWLDWFDRILPNKNDQRILFEYLAHCVKYPGYKIPWAPMLQSTEGIGKTIFREVMAHSLGDMYVYSPKAPELVKSGSTFNAWMRGKLMIVVDEIKIDERRELIEILKPMITDNRVEIQSKGVDQDMEDNPANWLFFSNYKDAIPITHNGRRYAIFYSALQSKADKLKAGMDKVYFQRLWAWLREGGGLQAISYWLLNYPIERGSIDVTAPETSSYDEALLISRSPLEREISECIANSFYGFRNGYISSVCALNRAKVAGIRSVSSRSVQVCLENMGYVHLGRAERSYFQEGPDVITDVWALRSDMTIYDYGRAQGYNQ